MLFFQVWIEGKCYFKSTNIHLLFKIIAHLNSLKKRNVPPHFRIEVLKCVPQTNRISIPGDILEIKLFEHNPRSTASCYVGQYSSVAQSCPTLCHPMKSAACQAFLSITNSWSLLKLMSIESVMPSNSSLLSWDLSVAFT